MPDTDLHAGLISELCAVVVTYQPKTETIENIRLLLEQVKQLVVVDNGSGEEAVKMLRQSSSRHAFTLILNNSNHGLAEALNIGVRRALAQGNAWVILFDQDSTITPSFISAMFDGYCEHSSRHSVGIFCPQYTDRATSLAVLTSRLHPDGGPVVAMTSGSLMPAWVFECCGWFLEELFIDQIDVEYCFRLRALGYKVARSPSARLLHSAGNPRVHGNSTMGVFRATHHSIARRYYITRNRLWVARHFWGTQRHWCIPMLWSIVRDTIKLLLVEDSKSAKLLATIWGVRDGFTGRLGKTVDL